MLSLRRASGNKFFVLAPLISAILLIAFLLITYLAYTTPIEVVTVNQIANYRHSGSYDYVASLKPNFIYGTTVLRLGEGVLYTKITKEIDISFNYSLNGSPKPEDTSLNTVWDVKLEAESKWNKLFTEQDASRIFNITKGATSTLTVNVTDVFRYVNIIEEEAGFYPSSFNMTFTPRITESFTIAGRPINSIYSPALKMEFTVGDRNGDYISIRNLTQSEAITIEDKVTTHNDAVNSQRTIWSIASLIALLVLTGSVWLWLTSTPRRSDELEKIIASNGELIIRNSTSPTGLGTINALESFEDLIKTSEILLKPILLHESETMYTFWIIDGNIEYQYKLPRKNASTKENAPPNITEIPIEKKEKTATETDFKQTSLTQTLIDRSLLFFGLPGAISLLVALGFGLWALSIHQTTKFYSTNMVFSAMVFTDIGLILIAISLHLRKKVNDEKRSVKTYTQAKRPKK